MRTSDRHSEDVYSTSLMFATSVAENMTELRIAEWLATEQAKSAVYGQLPPAPALASTSPPL
jgi:hypothetical protein